MEHSQQHVRAETQPASTPKKRRKMDTSNADARRAVGDILARFDEWRRDLTRFGAMAERRCSDADRETILERGQAIEEEVMAARTELIITLADAPASVAGNSRVVDVERALDNTEAALKALRAKLRPPSDGPERPSPKK